MKSVYTLGLWLSFFLLSCKESTQQQPLPPEINTADTVELPYPTDSNLPVDTNDHNKGTISTVTLDAPEGSPKSLPDSVVSHGK